MDRHIYIKRTEGERRCYKRGVSLNVGSEHLICSVTLANDRVPPHCHIPYLENGGSDSIWPASQVVLGVYWVDICES